MTATQSFRLYEIIARLQKNEADPKEFVKEIELALDETLAIANATFTPKSEVEFVRKDIELSRLELKKDIADLKSEMRGETNRLIIWLIGAIFASAGLIIAVLKLS